MKNIIWHPLLLAIFPILSLYNHNKDIADLFFLWQPLFIFLAAGLIIFGLSKIFIKDLNKSAIVATLLIVLFSSFGHYLNTINRQISLADYFIWLIVWLIVFISLTTLIINSRKKFNKLNTYLNVFSLVLVFFSAWSIISYQLNIESVNQTPEDKEMVADDHQDYPDIYYLVFDGYGRQDILSDIYDYDNADFLDYLREHNFYTATSSTANYIQTYLSVGSTLNLDYIDKLMQVDKDSDDRGPLKRLLSDSFVYNFLKERGYKFVTLPDTWVGTYKNLPSDIAINTDLSVNDFNNLIIDTFFGARDRGADRRVRFLSIFKSIPDVAEIEGPTFTYVHILKPHPPFIFGANGEAINSRGLAIGLDGDHYFRENPGVEEYRLKYKNQLIFINLQIQEIVEGILTKSDKEPIIILQSDHGPGSELWFEDIDKTNLKERLSILNAYYLPGDMESVLYQNISPINSFRLIFNEVFGQNFELLEDKSYFSTWSKPYDFIDVTERL